MKKPCLLIIFLLLSGVVTAQQLFFSKKNYTDSLAFKNDIPRLAKRAIEKYRENDRIVYFNNLVRLQLVAQDFSQIENSIHQLPLKRWWDNISHTPGELPYVLYSKTMDDMQKGHSTFTARYQAYFTNLYNSLNYDQKFLVNITAATDLNKLKTDLDHQINDLRDKDSLSLTKALALCSAYGDYITYAAFISLVKEPLNRIDKESNLKIDSVQIKMPDGGTISLTIARDKKISAPRPVILVYNIYAGNLDSWFCKRSVPKGYVGIVANTRGKRLSPDRIEPFEHDANDAYYIIDWISKQTWCNGKVGMFGGSYLGFSQWSAVKNLHPALKTIVPQAAVGAGIDFPMQNGIFYSYALQWLHEVTDNKFFTNPPDANDAARWDSFFRKWYQNGGSFRSLDTQEGHPNYIFHRWLQHPVYDSFWRKMTPQKEEFAKISIPILTTTGYWDDDQLGAMYYYKQYFKYNKNPNYYLLIGPYDHLGSQHFPPSEVSGYRIDSVAKIVVIDVVYQWFDYILKGAPRPSILQDKVNLEVMGENKWHHVSSLDQMHNDSLSLYLSDTIANGRYGLLKERPQNKAYVAQTVDLADRRVIPSQNEDIYNFPTSIDSVLKPGKEKLVFVSQPIDKPYAISGALTAHLIASINKKDVDVIIDLFEQTADGKYMALTESLQRASLSRDRTTRHLLTPGKIERIDIENTFITSRLLEKGSRVIIVLGVNKSPGWQINYGTGKDVSLETIKDAAIPLQIKWYNGSCIKLPVLR